MKIELEEELPNIVEIVEKQIGLSKETIITILKKVKCARNSHTGRLYYYQGNFYYPLFMLNKKEEARVFKALRLFFYKNKEMVLQDRMKPDYVSRYA